MRATIDSNRLRLRLSLRAHAVLFRIGRLRQRWLDYQAMYGFAPGERAEPPSPVYQHLATIDDAIMRLEQRYAALMYVHSLVGSSPIP